MTQGTSGSLIGAMWLVIGGMKLLSGLWALVMSVLAIAMTLLPQAAPMPTGVKAFFFAFPIGAATQCTLAALFLHGAIGLLRSQSWAPTLLLRLSWCALAFYAVFVFVILVFIISATGNVAEAQARTEMHLLLLVIPVIVLIVVAVPPVVTIVFLKPKRAEDPQVATAS